MTDYYRQNNVEGWEMHWRVVEYLILTQNSFPLPPPGTSREELKAALIDWSAHAIYLAMHDRACVPG